MTFCLESTFIKPEKNEEIKSAIILLHGYGGDGKDISTISLNWKRHLPNTIFCCPNGPEKCFINPVGYQWFDLTREEPEYILEQSKIAEKKLIQFIEEVKKKFRLTNDKICLSGFSQGCMMSINVGLTNSDQFNCIVGFSGKIINQNDLNIRKKNSTDVFLVHEIKTKLSHHRFYLKRKIF
jgi:phospholipase/carboxylesterase